MLGDAMQLLREKKKAVITRSRNAQRAESVVIRVALDTDMQRVVDLAAEKGVSSWLTCRPLKCLGLTLSKGEFQDSVFLHYNWLPDQLPSFCSCGTWLTVSHALSCPTGEYPSIRHNEVRDVTDGLQKRCVQMLLWNPTVPAAGFWGTVSPPFR